MKKQNKSIECVMEYAEEIRQIANSLVEDISDSKSMTEAWKKVDRFYQTVESMRNMQTATSSKSFSIINNEVGGHTKYLQGIDLPILINKCVDKDGKLEPSEVCEMHIETWKDRLHLLITPQ